MNLKLCQLQIEPGESSESMTTANTIIGNKNVAANAGEDVSSPNLGKRHNKPTPLTIDRKYHWSQISPSLYATPEPAPLPTSPTSSSPSPYVINHKRRGTSLLRTSSQYDAVRTKQAVIDEGVVDANDANDANATVVLTPIPKDMNLKLHYGNSGDGSTIASSVNGCLSRKDVISLESVNELQDSSIRPDKNNIEEEHGFGLQQYLNLATPGSEYFDAWDELSSESGLQLSLHHAEAELRQTRLNLSTEIENRNKAEESLHKLQCEWQKLREQLSLVGINLLADPTAALVEQEGETSVDMVGQFLSDSINSATARAEIEMERRIEAKNIEIARLWDKLHYYETMNSEMSQRNQDAMENARRLREGGRRWQRRLWVWGSVSAVAAVVVGAGVLGWWYLDTDTDTDTGKGSSTETDHCVAPEHHRHHETTSNSMKL